MFTLVIALLAPCVMLLTSRALSHRSIDSPVICLFEWTVDALLLSAVTLILFTPLGRVTVSPWQGNPLGFAYGKTAAAFNLSVALLLGVLQGRRRLNWVCDRGPIAPCFATSRSKIGRALLHLCGLLLLLLTFGYLWGVKRYPNVSLQEIVFYLTVPIQGTTKFFFSDFLYCVVAPSLLLFVLYELAAFLPCRQGGLRFTLCRRVYIAIRPVRVCLPLALVLMGGLLSLLLACFNKYLDLYHFLYSRIPTSELIEQEYVDPALVQMSFPEKKRNLINIYLESAETSFQDAENGGLMPVNYIPEMTRIARDNISFSHSNLLQGASVPPDAGWTTAALVAQTAGLPLKLVGQSGEKLLSFLPGATTLGDILRDEGYRLVFMAGSDFTFGGRRLYFTRHGDYEIWDLLSAREDGVLPEDYCQFWGFEDSKLYQYAKEALTQLSADDQPFHLCLLTVDTHTPGYLCDQCPDGEGERYLRILSCASKQLSDFLDWCEQQPFFEDTAIVITGDHASMAEPKGLRILGKYDIYGGSTDRLVYNAFIHAAAKPQQTTDRLFTTFDFFPTALAAIGVHIEGERLGLGVNLFSGEQTLAEKYGYQKLFTELAFRSPFYDECLLKPSESDDNHAGQTVTATKQDKPAN